MRHFMAKKLVIVLLLNRAREMNSDVTPFYAFTTFSKNRLDTLLRLIVGNLSWTNAPGITLNNNNRAYCRELYRSGC